MFALTRADVDLGYLYAQMMDISNQINQTSAAAATASAAAASGNKDVAGGDGGADGDGSKGGGGAGGSPGPSRSGPLVIKTSDSSVL